MVSSSIPYPPIPQIRQRSETVPSYGISQPCLMTECSFLANGKICDGKICFRISYGYGSIPINTMFNGMNIHKCQLFWGSLGTRVLTHPHMGFPWDFHLHPGHAGREGRTGHGHAAPESQGLPKRDPKLDPGGVTTLMTLQKK